MEGQKENSVVLKTMKRELTDELKNMPIDSLNGIDESDIRRLQSMGISTLGKLLQANTDQLYDRFKTQYYSRFWSIRYVVMEMGLLFNDDHEEFEQLGISDDVALIPISSLAISNRLKNTLTRKAGIYFLGDLLSNDYASLRRVRTLGEDGLIELKKYVHSLGYSLKDEEPALSEIKEEYKSKGITMVQEELGLDAKTSGVLYRNGIFTVQDLINYGERVFELVGMGDLKTQKLKAAMEAKDVHFGTSVVITPEDSQEPAAVVPTEQVVERLKQENTAIKIRIARKEELASEYDRLIAEREELIAREQKLDEEIASKIAMLQSVEQKGEGTYGRR